MLSKESIISRITDDFKRAESDCGFPADLEEHIRNLFPELNGRTMIKLMDDIPFIITIYKMTIKKRKVKWI